MSEGLTAPLVRAAAARVRLAGAALRSLPTERRCAAIAAAARSLEAPGAAAVDALAASSGLSAPMVRWALETTARTATEDTLAALLADAPGRREPVRLVALVLSGNVFTAPIRAIALPLLGGAPVLAKASSRDDVLPRLFGAALLAADPDVGAALEVLTFVGGDVALEDAMLAECEVLSAYGSDATLATLRARLPERARLLAHGHGLGVAYVPAAALAHAGATTALAHAAALDVAAYDQRGCLSPHAIFVEHGADAHGFAAALSGALDALAKTLPRGALPVEAAAQQQQWRGVAMARGDLREGDGFAVSVEVGQRLRVTPGYRNVSVLTTSAADLAERLAPLGPHLKALGVAGEEDLSRQLPTGLTPRLSAIGKMQTPPFDAPVDGRGPLEGLLR